MSIVSLSFPEPPEFAYDSQRPTFYSEYYAYCLHKHQAALSAAGASVHIENASHADQVAAVSTFANNLQAWSDGSVNSLVQYLTGGDDAVEPVLPDFPVVPELLESAVSLLPGGKLALLIKGAVPFIKGFLMLKEKLRPTDPVRILDKALLKESWWLPGYRKSWLEVISEKIDEKELSVDLSPIVEKLSCTVEIEGSQVSFSVAEILQNLLQAFSTVDCNGDKIFLADVLRLALTRCVPAGGDAFDMSTILDSFDGLAGVLSAMSIEVETEKAARVRLSGVDAASEIPFPNNL